MEKSILAASLGAKTERIWTQKCYMLR